MDAWDGTTENNILIFNMLGLLKGEQILISVYLPDECQTLSSIFTIWCFHQGVSLMEVRPRSDLIISESILEESSRQTSSILWYTLTVV